MAATVDTTGFLTEAREQELADYAEWIADTYFPGSAVDPVRLAREKRITVSHNDYGSSFDGLLEHRGNRFHIYCNTARSRTSARLRFTVGHELGHYFIDEHREALRSGRVEGAQLLLRLPLEESR